MTITTDVIKLFEAVLIGVVFSVIYDIIRGIRYELVKSKIFEFVADVLWFASFSLVTFIYIMIRNNGQMRVFFIIGELCGMILYFFTVSKFIVKGLRKLNCMLRKIMALLIIPIVKIVRELLRKIRIQVKYIIIKNKIKKHLEKGVDNSV